MRTRFAQVVERFERIDERSRRYRRAFRAHRSGVRRVRTNRSRRWNTRPHFDVVANNSRWSRNSDRYCPTRQVAEIRGNGTVSILDDTTRLTALERT
jgi:hypothetical protein